MQEQQQQCDSVMYWLLQRLETALHTAVEQCAGAEVVEALLIAGANYDATEKVLLIAFVFEKTSEICSTHKMEAVLEHSKLRNNFYFHYRT